jgi:hypothetical protein
MLPRVLCRTPTPGKKPTRIDRVKFERIRRAILECVPRSTPGVEFQKLPGLVSRRLSQAERASIGSIRWYVTTVKLELEVRGEIRRLAGSRPQRLVQDKERPPLSLTRRQHSPGR